MKLTEKDKEFLTKLKQLVDSKDLWVELKPGRPSSMVLRGTYGEKIHDVFRMTRQGVRWRFWRVLNDIYVTAFETVIFVEKSFGPQLREFAVRISKERYALRQDVAKTGSQDANLIAEPSKQSPHNEHED